MKLGDVQLERLNALLGQVLPANGFYAGKLGDKVGPKTLATRLCGVPRPKQTHGFLVGCHENSEKVSTL